MSRIAHSLKEKSRTDDVIITENVDFRSLLLSKNVSQGLANAGFHKPSPIQLKAIPLGRCGLDLIVQAKSGTGKTCVFSVVSLETIQIDSSSTQVLVLAPTREIAIQIWEVICGIGSAMPGLKCNTFIGGLPLQEDRMKLKKTQIAIGTPGRVKQLIESGILKTDSIRLFVLDEADKLLEESFQDQINWIYSSLPENKQMLALSATYPEYLADHLTAYMRNPTFLRLNISDPALLGIRQYYQTVPYHPISHVVFEEKTKALTTILSSVSFQQCLVFSNLQTRAQNLADNLNNKGWPTACIAGCLDQKDRNHAMAKLKTYKCRILISTDLTSRGIDADKVNMVINLDVPKDHETYLHRIGRAGRFGSFGIAITLVSDGQEKMDLNLIEKRCNTNIHPVPAPIPEDLASVSAPIHLDDVVSSEVINTTHRPPKEPTHKKDFGYVNGSKDDSVKEEKDIVKQTGINNSVKKLNLESDTNNVNYKSPSEEQERDFIDQSFHDTKMTETSEFVNGDIFHSDKEVEKNDTKAVVMNRESTCNLDKTNEAVSNSESASALNPGTASGQHSDINSLSQNNSDLKLESECNMKSLATASLMDPELSSKDQINLKRETGTGFKENNDADAETNLSEASSANNSHAPASEQTLFSNSERLNGGWNNKTKFQPMNKKKRKPRKEEFKDSFVQGVSQPCKDDEAGTQSKHIGGMVKFKQMDKVRLDYKTEFSSFKPPEIKIVELFKQTIGHKAINRPHTYESAKAELQSYEPDSSEPSEKQSVIPKFEKHDNHNSLMTAIHELQVMFDRTTIKSSLQNTNAGMEMGRDADDDKSNNLMGGQESVIKNVVFMQDTAVSQLAKGEEKIESIHSKEKIDSQCDGDTVALVKSENETKAIISDTVVKPKKYNRIGYTGKFAIAHLLQQGDFERNDSKNIDKACKQNCEINLDGRKNIEEDETCYDSVENIRNQENIEAAQGLHNGTDKIPLDTGESVEERYRDLLLESSAVENLLQNETEDQCSEHQKSERKSSFSSDSIVTEDSDSGSSGEEMLAVKQDHFTNNKFEKKTNLEKHRREKANSNKSNNSTNWNYKAVIHPGKKDPKKYGVEYEDYKEDFVGYEESNDSHLQHHPAYTGYPYTLLQQFPARNNKKASKSHQFSMPGYPYGQYYNYSQQGYPFNYYHAWYQPFSQPFQQYPMQYPSYPPYPPPYYWPYSMPYNSKIRPDMQKDMTESDGEEGVKQDYKLQKDYIKLMCENREGGKRKRNKTCKKTK